MRRLTILLAAVGALMLVPAASALAETVTLTIDGTGTGEVSSAEGLHAADPNIAEVYIGEPPIECSYASPGPQSGTCENEAEDLGEGFVATALHATPAPGSEFTGWTATGGEQFGEIFTKCFTSKSEWRAKSKGTQFNDCFAYSAAESGSNVSVVATFCLEGEIRNSEGDCSNTPALKLKIEEGSGTVVLNPSGLTCSGTAPRTCGIDLAEGSVTLTASPAPGYAFKSWKKCDSGGVNGRQCTITATSSTKEVGVKFIKVWNLDTAKAGTGLGKVQTSPGGVLCLYNCQSAAADFKEGSVTVKAAAAKNNHFVQWLGDCSGSSLECTLNMNEAHEVEAEFAPDTQYALSVSKTGGGTASIKSSPSGLLCGYTCGSQTASFYSGATVSIAVTLNKGTTALEWTSGAGTCTGSALTCTVTMSEATSLVAKLS